MPTLIEQIQRDAIDSEVPVTTVLRRIKLAAGKLGLPQVEAWVESELNGYSGGDVPDYRKITGRPMGLNPYHGWIPLPHQLADIFENFHVLQPIASIEDLIINPPKNGIQMNLPPQMAAMLDEMLDPKLGRYALHYSRTHVISIVNAVRNLSLEWAMAMERNGVKGTEFSFNSEEKFRAQGVPMSIHTGPIGTFIGNMGSGNTTENITVGNIDVREAAALGEQIKGYLPLLEKEGVDVARLQPHLDVLEAESKQAEPSQSKIQGALTDLRNALSGASGSLLASGIIEGIARLLG